MNETIDYYEPLEEWPELTKMWDNYKKGIPTSFNDIITWHREAMEEEKKK